MRSHGLNDSQLEAVRHTRGPLLVLAGAGTGKTRVITHRIAHLLNLGVPPDRILALSFTNKAAREVAERVRALSREQGGEVTVSTFHSLGLLILKQEGKRVGLGSGFTLVSEGERRGALRQIVRETAPELDPSVVGDAISRWKNKGMTADCVKQSSEQISKAILNSYALYEASMKAQRAADFDDLLLLPLRALKIHEDARLFWANRFDYIMVDEYQDTNRVQFELLKILAGEKNNIAVVGDDDQAIYGWRGAEVELILRFPDHFPGCRTVVLTENYRSTPVILEAAHSVVEKLEARHPKKLKVAEGMEYPGQEPIHCIEAEDENAEAEEVATNILTDRYRTKRPWSHFAVLYRVNGQSRAFEQALRTHDIPHVVIGGNRYFDHKEVRDVLSYLKVILNPRDDAALLRIANVPKRGLGQQSMLKLKEEAVRDKVPLAAVLERADELSPQARAGARTLLEILREFRGRFSAEGLTPDNMEDFIARVNFRDDVRANYESARAVQKRIGILDELPQTVAAIAGGRKSIPLDRFIESLTLDPPVDREEEDSDAVRLMTLHSAKGLEFPVVFLTGLEEGLLPLLSSRGSDPGREEEERRLCYVGMTRAQKRLTLSRALARARNGAVRSAPPSRFLQEVPSNLTGQGGMKVGRDPEEEKEMAANFFENIRKMLGS